MRQYNVGIAPTGKRDWEVSKTKKTEVQSERARIEASIGNIKKPIYGFNKPDAKSVPAMESCGQRAFIGHNLHKLLREMKKLEMQTA